ncbi:MAG TPA: DUF3857 domain-containing protein, partial [Mucilaginibacter sp.]
MNKRNFYCLLLTAATFIGAIAKAHGQDKDIPKELYKAASIPDSLKEDANSVVRYSMKEYTVDGPGKAIDKIHTIVTVLNDKADDEAGISLPYNRKFSSVSSFEMKVYGADGNLLKKYHKSDMYDHGVIDESIITDDRELSIGYNIASYPVTIEMIYEVDERSLINLDTWHIQYAEQSVQNEYCRLSISKDAGLRYID